MIRTTELRALARERGLPLDVVQKDYYLGLILVDIMRSRAGTELAFKGGTPFPRCTFPRVGGFRKIWISPSPGSRT